MKKLKFLPTIMMLVVCVAVLAFGVLAISPTTNKIAGSIVVVADKGLVEIGMTVTGHDGEDIIVEPKVIEGNETFTVGDLFFNLKDANRLYEVPNIEIAFTIKNRAKFVKNNPNQNLADKTLGVFFSTNGSIGDRLAEASDVCVSHELKTGETVNVSTLATSYSAIMPQETLTMKLTLTLESFDLIENVDLPFYLYVEQYQAGNSGGLVKLPVVSTEATESADAVFFSEITATTLADMGIDKNDMVNLAIPSTITEIPDSTKNTGAFIKSNNLVGVGFNNKLTKIGEYAFHSCPSLKHVDLSGCTALEEVGDGAFGGFGNSYYSGENNSLKGVDLSGCSALTKIGKAAFCGCAALESVNFDNCDNLTYIEPFAFYGCGSLKKLDLSNKTKLVYIGDGDECVFDSCTSLKSVNLSGCSALEVIGESAFSGCSALESINFDGCEALTNIRGLAFFECTSLKSIDLSNKTNLTYIGGWCFDSCSSLESINLSGCVKYKSLGDSIDGGCENLKSVNLNGCKVMTSVYLYGLPSLENVDLTGCVAVTSIHFSGCENLTEVDLSDCTALTTINASAFGYCTSLERVVGLSSVTRIEISAFEGCTSLVSVGDLSGVTEIGAKAFKGCASLESVGELENLLTINESTFEGCASLKSVGNLDIVTTIGAKAFKGCEKLSSFAAGGDLATIGDSAFSGCSALTLNLGNLCFLTQIGDRAFENCLSLKNFSIDTWLDQCEIGNYVFAGCVNLDRVTFYEDKLIRVGEKIFYECSPDLKIHVEGSIPSSFHSQWNYRTETEAYEVL